ncbi:MAG: hypothetical protein A3J67_06425 [Parcubacteria group bacterium RIFCSPHIGHO2_02_FULL_48_10b]|nr:MAG: hypothetical protein A3J67_06425 [Parcubacteria group bacterium RIFCSPHIGHO2_02_FULL_48_10b]
MECPQFLSMLRSVCKRRQIPEGLCACWVPLFGEIPSDQLRIFLEWLEVTPEWELEIFQKNLKDKQEALAKGDIERFTQVVTDEIEFINKNGDRT